MRFYEAQRMMEFDGGVMSVPLGLFKDKEQAAKVALQDSELLRLLLSQRISIGSSESCGQVAELLRVKSCGYRVLEREVQDSLISLAASLPRLPPQ